MIHERMPCTLCGLTGAALLPGSPLPCWEDIVGYELLGPMTNTVPQHACHDHARPELSLRLRFLHTMMPSASAP